MRRKFGIETQLRISLLLATVVLSACIEDGRVTVENALIRLRQIRLGEENYHKSRGKYGSLRDLAETNVIPNEISDGVDLGYAFQLSVGDAGYAVNANPLKDTGSCFFMDETGVIKAENAWNEPANKSSPAIKNQ